jgi:4-amino-4-deoxy-L-arabinose transferase-like glycosyltransferase
VRKHLPLALILGIAAVARFWAIDFCLPTLVCRPDEEAVASIATRFFARDPNPHFFDWPPVFMYAVALAMVPYFKYAKYTGWIRSEFRFLQSISNDPTPLFLAARLLSAAAGTASVWLVYRIAHRLFDRTTALIAAAFLALSYLHVRDSHFGVTDIPSIFVVLIVLLCCTRLAAGVTRRDLLIAGVMTGVAAATKYNAGAIALPVLWILATNPLKTSVKSILSQATLYVIVAGAVFLAAAPFTVIESAAFVQSLNSISSHLLGGHGPDVGRGWWVHPASSLRYGVGAPGLFAGIVGLAWLAWQSPRIGVMLLLFPVATYLMIGNGLTVFARYALPIVPFLCLGAAYAVTRSTRAIAESIRKPDWQAALAWTAALGIVAPSAIAVWQFDRLLSIEDSRLIAAHWIEARFPGGATIGETERRFNRLSFRSADPAMPSPFQAIVLTPDTPDPDVIVVAESPLHPGGLPPEITAERLSHYQRAFETSGPERPGSIYDWQDEFYIPLAGIDHLERPGPRITIWTRR